MAKKWIFGGLVLGGIVAAVLRRRSSSYDSDEIDSAAPGTFGERSTLAPEQKWAPAETRQDIGAEALATAARVETSFEDIQRAWPGLTLDEIRGAEGDLDRLAQLIADKVGEPKDDVRKRLEGIIAADAPDGVYPAH